MAARVIGPPPFPPVIFIDRDDPVTVEFLRLIVEERPEGVTICVRYATGPAKRGGYFFHIAAEPDTPDHYTLIDFDKHPVATVPIDFLVRFINHCTGRQFDAAAFAFSESINFRQDD